MVWGMVRGGIPYLGACQRTGDTSGVLPIGTVGASENCRDQGPPPSQLLCLNWGGLDIHFLKYWQFWSVNQYTWAVNQYTNERLGLRGLMFPGWTFQWFIPWFLLIFMPTNRSVLTFQTCFRKRKIISQSYSDIFPTLSFPFLPSPTLPLAAIK